MAPPSLAIAAFASLLVLSLTVGLEKDGVAAHEFPIRKVVLLVLENKGAAEVFGPDLLEEATKRPAIRHFEGPELSKPWHYLCPYPGRKEHRALLAETPWAGIPLEDRTAATWFLRLFRGEMRYRAYARLLQARSRLPDLAR